MLFRLIGKQRRLPWPLIDRGILNFFSETAEWNLTKLDRKQVLNILYTDSFWDQFITKDGLPCLLIVLLAETCSIFPLQPLNRIVLKLALKQVLIALYQELFWADTLNIVAAFRGMHVSPAKHSYAWLPRKCDYRTDTRTDTQTDGQTDARQSNPYVPLCFAGDTTKGAYGTHVLVIRPFGPLVYIYRNNMLL